MNITDYATSIVASVEIEAGANPTVSAFFKAYSKVSPKLKKVKSKSDLLLVEQATDALNKLSRSLGDKGTSKDKKGKGFNIKVPSKKERMKSLKS